LLLSTANRINFIEVDQHWFQSFELISTILLSTKSTTRYTKLMACRPCWHTTNQKIWSGSNGSSLVVLSRKKSSSIYYSTVLNVFLSPKNFMYKIYFVPNVQEMTAMWSVWLCTYGQTLGAPCTKSTKISSENPNFLKPMT